MKETLKVLACNFISCQVRINQRRIKLFAVNFLNKLNEFDYFDKSFMIVSKRIELSSTKIEESVAISINNVVTLACFQVNEVQDL